MNNTKKTDNTTTHWKDIIASGAFVVGIPKRSRTVFDDFVGSVFEIDGSIVQITGGENYFYVKLSGQLKKTTIEKVFRNGPLKGRSVYKKNNFGTYYESGDVGCSKTLVNFVDYMKSIYAASNSKTRKIKKSKKGIRI